jgi:hypothetical protein
VTTTQAPVAADTTPAATPATEATEGGAQ